ncbi:recombinase family protein [Clostridium tyrobutyricum]|jgi:predicted RNase H-like nuclease (RuvC/YqgF family)|uniref:recombinase family protein n=1 Tax=Clostridium tyrobutyricum TaxID=1519 RepID=UPI0018AAFAC0|nr:recombinase family protein [Clostridium tyrobutyricum]
MPRITIKEMQEKLNNAQKTIEMQIDEISRLNKELDNTRNNVGVVSSAEFKSVITELETKENLYKLLEEQKNKEIEKLKTKVDLLNAELKKNKSTVINSEHNSRGAGRKEFQDYDTVKTIYKSYSEGKSLQNIADALNKANIKTKKGGSWAKSSIRFILLNNVYVEKRIIDEEMFNLITERMKRK